MKQFVPGPQGVGMQGWSIHPVIVSGLGINPGLQSQIATAPLLVEQIVPGPQGLGSHGSAWKIKKTFSNNFNSPNIDKNWGLP